MKTDVIKWYDAERECEFVFAQLEDNRTDDYLVINGVGSNEDLLGGKEAKSAVIDGLKSSQN